MNRFLTTSKNRATPKLGQTKKSTIQTAIKEEVKLVRYEKHWIEAVIDTVKIVDEERSRITEAVEQALQVGKGTMIVIDAQRS